MWVYIIIGLFFIVIGLAVHVLKWYFLISGYNTCLLYTSDAADE